MNAPKGFQSIAPRASDGCSAQGATEVNYCTWRSCMKRGTTLLQVFLVLPHFTGQLCFLRSQIPVACSNLLALLQPIPYRNRLRNRSIRQLWESQRPRRRESTHPSRARTKNKYRELAKEERGKHEKQKGKHEHTNAKLQNAKTEM